MDKKDYYLLLDTDIGDDIDDSFALAIAAKSGCKLVAVTTVFRNTVLRAKQAAQLLKACNSSAPVYAGESVPVDGIIPLFGFEKAGDELIKAVPCQYDESMKAYSYSEGAVDAIIAAAKKYSGKLILAPIGGLTNIAEAIRKDPSIVNDVKAIYAMHGWYGNCSPEWNVLCDVEGANIVYSSGVPFYGVGLDVTLKCTLDKELLDKFRSSEKPYNKLIVTYMDRWFDAFHFDKSVMHDPLAVLAALGEPVCKFEKRYVRAITEGEKRGANETVLSPKEGFYPIMAATEVDKQAFYSAVERILL
ncbi:MAG: nucleoside hydrolase [Clostridia bacterium]|nr:nucleoside hydrolase [Clostridia bacterium]